MDGYSSEDDFKPGGSKAKSQKRKKKIPKVGNKKVKTDEIDPDKCFHCLLPLDAQSHENQPEGAMEEMFALTDPTISGSIIADPYAADQRIELRATQVRDKGHLCQNVSAIVS